jgi:potassium-dependent mechanosensitive channel
MMARRGQRPPATESFRRIRIWVLVICSLMFVQIVSAEPEEPPAAQPSEYSDLAKARDLIESSLESEKQKLEEYRRRLSDLQRLDEIASERIKAYEIQLSAQSNLLMRPDARVDEIEDALGKNTVEMQQVSFYLEDWKTKVQDIQRNLAAAREQLTTNQKQMENLQAVLDANPVTEALIRKQKDFLQILFQKAEIFQEMEKIYTRNIEKLENTHQELIKFSEEFDRQLKEKRKAVLFQRKKAQGNLFDLTAIGNEMAALLPQSRERVADDLQSLRIRFRENGDFPLIAFFVLFSIIEILLFRLQRFCYSVNQRYQMKERHFWRFLLLRLFRQSLLILGATLFLLVYGYIRNLHHTISLFRVAFYVICIWLFTRWGLCFLKLWNQEAKQAIPTPTNRRFRSLLYWFRVFGLLYVVVLWALGGHSLILIWVRLVFEISLVLWCMLFWRLYSRTDMTGGAFSTYLPISPKFWMGLSYVISLGALLLEMAGYGILALYWLTSWGFTFGFLLWVWLLYEVLREAKAQYKIYLDQTPAESQPAFPVRWVLIQIGWLLWAGILALTLLFSWKIDKTDFFTSYLRLLNIPITIGNFRLSIMVLVYVILALILTHAVVRVWQNLFVDKILAESGIERGLKNSITVIVSYLLWAMGILIALHVIGFSTQSLAVILGALGIGLGFGLQNIFNNFFSGIILLFERPIQVGDAVEIKGVWGEVKKINIRATQVQTYDNASLIIPNSEFVSSQVTNWSFKDMRIRRNITVGVAYGSDIQAVRDTLMEIADSNSYVFKYPKPSVLFTDFGDSSLLFKLRVWTEVDNCLTAETEIRFEIDRLFREKSIEIAFPQRDLHLRSIAKEVLAVLKPASDSQNSLEIGKKKT